MCSISCDNPVIPCFTVTCNLLDSRLLFSQIHPSLKNRIPSHHSVSENSTSLCLHSWRIPMFKKAAPVQWKLLWRNSFSPKMKALSVSCSCNMSDQCPFIQVGRCLLLRSTDQMGSRLFLFILLLRLMIKMFLLPPSFLILLLAFKLCCAWSTSYQITWASMGLSVRESSLLRQYQQWCF